jgi:hypothetical protein
MKRMNYFLLILTFLALLFGVTTVFARKPPPPPPPVVTVVSRWTPQEQLVSDSSLNPSDIRTVNLQMSARSDRQFWAMDISCIVSQLGVFESIGPIMTWAGGWSAGTSPHHSDVTVSYFGNDGTNDRIYATITRVGASNSPMGLNGTTYAEFLFNLELTLTEGLVGTNTISITCDKLLFLDRNGASLGNTTLSNTNNLTIRDGYVISGSAARQGNSDQSEIDVSCEHVETGNTYVANTETIQTFDSKGRLISEIKGLFSFSNAFESSDPLRDFGLYKCTHTSKFGGTEDTVYLKGISYINLQTPDYTLQPITLRSGNTNISGTSATKIDIDDFIPITTHWQDSVTSLSNGDVNGDGFTNETDLAITAGNVGLSNVSGGVLMDHVLYSVARDYNGTFPNNTLVMGDVFSGDVSTLNSDRVFWPQISPDGSQVAYYGSSTNYYDKKGRLLPSAKGARSSQVVEGLLVGNTSSFSGSLLASGRNFAPSWSPSGGQIAYVCSWDGFQNGIEGYYYNNGNICIVDASSGTVQTIIPPDATSTYAEIFPPTWYDETTLVYAGNTDNGECPDQLCYYDMLTNTHGLLGDNKDGINDGVNDGVNGVDGSSTFANMPIIIRKSDSLSYLFYRYFTSGSSELRMGTIAYDSATGLWSGGVSSLTVNTAPADRYHEQIDTTGDSEKDIHYYDVSPMLDVMYYGFGDYQFHNLYLMDGTPFSWTQGDDHSVDGFIGYPTINEYNNVWDGFDELTAGTDFHAFRATFDWLP